MDIRARQDTSQLNNSYKAPVERVDAYNLDHVGKTLGHTTDNHEFWIQDQCEETDILYCDKHLKERYFVSLNVKEKILCRTF